MSTNKFFFWFWVIYLPTCILFYDRMWQTIDEAMTVVLFLFTITKVYGKKMDSIGKEILWYIVLMIFYVAYSIVLKINVQEAIFYDLQQQVRPYIVFFCSYLIVPEFTEKQKKRLIRWFIICDVVYVGSFFIGFRISKYGLSTPMIGQAALLTASMYLLFKENTRKNVIKAIAILSIGLLSLKSKFFGEFIVFIALFYFLKSRLKPNLKTIISVIALTGAIVYFTWEKFNAYYIEGMDETTSTSNRMARPESFKTASTIIFNDYIPFGSGLASFGTNAAAKYYSPLYYKYHLDSIWGLYPENPMFLADAFYPTLAQYGLVGLFFFLWFWIRRYQQALHHKEFRAYKVAMMMIFALFLESMADTSYLSGKGMGYFMLLAMAIKGSYVNKKKVILINNDSEKPLSDSPEGKGMNENGDPSPAPPRGRV